MRRHAARSQGHPARLWNATGFPLIVNFITEIERSGEIHLQENLVLSERRYHCLRIRLICVKFTLADALPETPGRSATGAEEESEVPNEEKDQEAGSSPPSSGFARSANMYAGGPQDTTRRGSDIPAAALARLDACHAENLRLPGYCEMRQVLRRVDAKGPIDRIRGATADCVRAT